MMVFSSVTLYKPHRHQVVKRLYEIPIKSMKTWGEKIRVHKHTVIENINVFFFIIFW